ncbi:MAG TPA: alanine--tRNA ligase [Acidobacteriota bacterium]|nr:alanine--tRNA ligase [Acidobacteriota bacterium]
MIGNEVRGQFLKYFEERGHRVVKSSSLVPENDPTLLFTNAGMNQFKDVFLGVEHRDYRRATTCQKCMRVSGKHNDLEQVGRTPRHHTFFEMLGNFSFGDYFKKEAIPFSWELLTGVYGIPPDRLFITIFEDDDEAYEIWNRSVGIPSTRIFRLGESDNFWAMGETGPCGPCSELHYDFGQSPAGHKCEFPCECGRFVEIWNLVFMQFNRDASGQMTPLPKPSIDTGAGLERVACVLQGKRSNFETDLFWPIIQEASRLTSGEYGETEKVDTTLRIIADHSRAAAFLIADGVLPGNEGRGYVLRKIMRRAIRYGKQLGSNEPFLFQVCAFVATQMRDVYPEVGESREYVARVVRSEEEKFSTTLSYGLRLIEDLMSQSQKQGSREISGREIFKLYDTYGFPFDLAKEIVEERGLTIREQEFQEELEKQRERARQSWKGGEKQVKPLYQELAKNFNSEFVGYDAIRRVNARVLAILRGDARLTELHAGEEGELLLDRTPFYAEAGGQVGDQGVIETEQTHASVRDVKRPVSGIILHKVHVDVGTLRQDETVICSVSERVRQAIALNHTATHLLHAALREVLGPHIKQAGSLVAPDRLRFDFTHFAQVTKAELQEIERLVNEKIRENVQVDKTEMELDEALKTGAMALFGEKYTRRVRVVSISDFSKELCGGTHVGQTGDIALFKITSEGGIAAGIRRIEAVTGEAALDRFLEDEALLDNIAETFRSSRKELILNVERLAQSLKETQKQLEQLKLKLATADTDTLLSQAHNIQGIQVITKEFDNLDSAQLRAIGEHLRSKMKSGIVILGSKTDGKASLLVVVTPNLAQKFDANLLIKKIAPIIGGGGGGKPEMAEAGGKAPDQIGRALEESIKVIENTASPA